MNLLNDLQWRYATKRMNGKHVPNEKVMQVIEAARLAPTSSGLQPFKVVMIEDLEIRKKIAPIAMNQKQITECSHLLVFAAWDSYTQERMDSVFDNMEAIRELPKGEMNEFKNSVSKSMQAKSEHEQYHHAARQAYIGFGMAIAAAAELRIDASPMEGFHNDELDVFLGLDKLGLKSVTLLALGYRNEEEDWLLPMKKVRFPLEDFLIEVK